MRMVHLRSHRRKKAVVPCSGQQVVLVLCKVSIPDGHGMRMADAPALLHGTQVVQLHIAPTLSD